MALFSPSQISKKQEQPKPDVGTLVQELIKNLQVKLPSISEGLGTNPFAPPMAQQAPSGVPGFQTSENLPPLQALGDPTSAQLQPARAMPSQSFGASPSDAQMPVGVPPATGVGNSPSGNLGFVDNQPGGAYEHFNASYAELMKRLQDDPRYKYSTYDEVKTPHRQDIGMTAPMPGSDTQKSALPPSLDIALLSSGLGGLLGAPGFGTMAGSKFLESAMGTAKGEDADRFKADQGRYDDLNRIADRTYAQDVDKYGVETRSIDSRNNDVTRRINNETDALQAKYGVEQRAETANEKTAADKNRMELKAILDRMEKGNLPEADLEEASKFVNSRLGTHFSDVRNSLTPEQQARFDYLTTNMEQRKTIADNALKAKKDNLKTGLGAIDERLKKSIAATNARAQKARSLQGDIAQLRADSAAYVKSIPTNSANRSTHPDQLRAMNDAVSKAGTMLGRSTTLLKDAEGRLQSARMAAAKIRLNEKMIDPSYKDQKDPNMNGLNENGRSAMAPFTSMIGDALGNHWNATRAYNSALEEYNTTSTTLKQFLQSGASQTSENTGAFSLPSGGQPPSLQIGNPPRLGQPFAPPSLNITGSAVQSKPMGPLEKKRADMVKIIRESLGK